MLFRSLFAAQQLRGPASTWWGNFVAVQPANHQVTWEEFKVAFREHYIPEGVLHMKQEEFMKLKQGGDTVNQYLNKFNHLSQYASNKVIRHEKIHLFTDFSVVTVFCFLKKF